MSKRAQAFPLERFLPYRLSVLTNTVSRLLAREYAEAFGISPLEWRVLAVVGRFAPTTAAEVSLHSAMDKVAVSRAVSGLLERGLLLRRVDRSDRRRGLLSLSARGSEVHARIAARAGRLERELLAALSPDEQAALDGLLTRLSARTAQLTRAQTRKDAR